VTVFVAANAAFDRLDPVLASALREGGLDNELRYTLLVHHYVHRLYPSSEWESGPHRTWRGGGSIELTLDPPTWGGCPIAQSDIRVNNDYIHVLDGIVIPDEIQQAAAG
jgi:Fasciclin domain